MLVESFIKQGFVCIEIADILKPTLAMSGLFRELDGTNWDIDTLLNVLSDLKFQGRFPESLGRRGASIYETSSYFENEIVSLEKCRL